jgi:hypothetical protein
VPAGAKPPNGRNLPKWICRHHTRSVEFGRLLDFDFWLLLCDEKHDTRTGIKYIRQDNDARFLRSNIAAAYSSGCR